LKGEDVFPPTIKRKVGRPPKEKGPPKPPNTKRDYYSRPTGTSPRKLIYIDIETGEVKGLLIAALNVFRGFKFRTLGSYIPLPTVLADKKVITNMNNKDKECFKWSAEFSRCKRSVDKNH